MIPYISSILCIEYKYAATETKKPPEQATVGHSIPSMANMESLI